MLRRRSSQSSGRFSRILDDLGNENYDWAIQFWITFLYNYLLISIRSYLKHIDRTCIKSTLRVRLISHRIWHFTSYHNYLFLANMSETYSEQRLSLAELVIQSVTHALFLLFLVFFIYRLYRLRSLSMTETYEGNSPNSKATFLESESFYLFCTSSSV